MVWSLRTNGITRSIKEEPTVPAFLQPANRYWNRLAAWISTELNFYVSVPASIAPESAALPEAAHR